MTPATRLSDALAELFAPDPRHAWLRNPKLGEQIKRWREEDEANGQPWADEKDDAK